MSKKKKSLHDLPVIIGMATIEERYESMLDTVKSLEGQFDELHVYANDYGEDVPMFSRDNGIYWHDAPDGDLGDTGFMWPFRMQRVSGKLANDPDRDYSHDECICMIVGDDVIYPSNYVETMISELERIGTDKAISLHGRRQFSPLKSYYNSLKPEEAFNGFRNVPRDERVTVLGTAYACWHSSLIDFSMEDFPQEWNGMNSRNMGDIWFSKKLNESGIERVVVKHKSNWVQHTKKIDMSKTLSVQGKESDPVQTALFNSVEWSL